MEAEIDIVGETGDDLDSLVEETDEELLDLRSKGEVDKLLDQREVIEHHEGEKEVKKREFLGIIHLLLLSFIDITMTKQTTPLSEMEGQGVHPRQLGSREISG